MPRECESPSNKAVNALMKLVIGAQAAPQQASQAAEKKPAAKSGPKVDATSAAGGSAETMGQRQEDVRKWINDWRAK